RRRDCALKIFMNEGLSWRGISHNHPATFDTLAMDPPTKQAVIADLDRFLKRKEYYRRIGKAWKRGYLLYGPPGTGKSSLVAAVANYLRFNLYDLDLSEIQELLAEVEVTPAEVSEMLLRNEDADIALLGLVEFLTPKKQGKKDSVK
uniref:AAA+ ATPase At3g28540-like C-terminal domain-containing protein n=1 Tax=Aegilops tauschii subsp. strangulata TaxID=200361 RepID=A0A453BDX2_AEGTS